MGRTLEIARPIGRRRWRRTCATAYPGPESDAFQADAETGIAYATLAALIAFKLASGIWGNRLRDLADLEGLICANSLDETFEAQLPESLRPAFRERLRASRLERDIE